MAKIVFIGAGSASFGLSVFRDVFTNEELAGSTLALVDINEENLERMRGLACLMNEQTGLGLQIEDHTDRRQALPGADFVICSIAIRRNELWKLDFEVPKKHGIRHVLGENGGPGALFFTLRTIPLILDIARDMEDLCPKALFLNFSNPESRIILALARYANIKAVGLCHGVFMGRDQVARIMELDPEEVDVWAAGLNHFQWLLQIRRRQTGEDLYPLLRQKEKDFEPSFMPFARKLFRAFGYYPSCSDDHIGEYLPYGWEAGEEGYDFEADDRHRRSLQEDIDRRVINKASVADWLTPSGEKAIDVITAVMHNKKQFIESGVVYNGTTISNLPADLAVEVPIMVDANGVHPQPVGDLPSGPASLLTLQVGPQKLSVEAAAKGSKELALQALLADPVITGTDAAVAILEELWEVNKPYIRNCL